MRGITACVLALMAAACVDPSPPGVAPTPDIVGGQTTTTTAFPTVVDLENAPGDWFCTGTLIETDWVLTAAHCVLDQQVSTLNVRLGGEDITQGTGGTVVPALSLAIDPEYVGTVFGHDLALVQLSTAVTDRTPTAIDRTVLALNTPVTQVGFGDNDNFGDGAGVLRDLPTVVVDCAAAGDPSITNADLLCFDASVHASCFGDSGGPAFVTTGASYVVGGVTSGGTGSDCTGPGIYDIYTAVSADLGFIDGVLGTGSDGSGSGSETGSGTSGGSVGGGGASQGSPEDDSGGCASGGGGGAWLGLVIAAMALASGRAARGSSCSRSARTSAAYPR